ncbi:MAG TPA: BTAD domain-containing putative transcriptional regulator [Solirubrobacteraceae bacterium]|nr:BTAD domain-containing putative transcriptional regulator [Solirubrobacteraceae bacterium]
MEFRVLGPLEAIVGSTPVALRPKPRALLARLLLDAGRTVSVPQLVEDLWGEEGPESAPKMVQIYVSQLRKALPDGVLRTRAPGYALEVDPDAVDVTRFVSLREEGRAALAAGDPVRASARLSEALALWRGPALAEFPEPFAAVEGARLEELRLVCVENRIEADVAAGRHADVVGELEALVARHPLREALHGQLMLALYRSGRQAEALATYDRFRRTLDEELGIEPSEPLKRLHVDVLRQDPGLAPAGASLPPALGGFERTFVGRAGDLGRLRSAWERARAGRLQVAMIGGEPGIGKTRLAAEFARAAHAEGAVVLFGHCDEDLGIPYQPFGEALGSRIEPAPGMQRHQLFEAVAAGLAERGGGRPLVAVLDDLHWADAPTLLLLRYLVRAPAAPPALIVGTYRDTELSRAHPLAEALAELRRGGLVERVSLTGLTSGDFPALLAAVAGREVPPALTETIHRETEGNPFFAEEVLRHLEESGGIEERRRIGIPEGVKETIGRRLARLPPGCDAVLATAAVLGRTWEYEVVRAMVPAGEDDLLGAVEAALAAQLIVEGEEPVYSFSHALVRETLYDDLSRPRRQRLHLQAAEAIERVHAAAVDAHASELALHYGLAGTAADPAVARRWLMRAGELAAAQLAWEDAAAHWDAAAEAMPAGAERAALLERLGDLKYAANFDLPSGTAQLEEALAHHERAGDVARAARVRSRIGRNLTTFYGPVHDVDRGRELLEAADVVIREEGEGVPLASVYLGLATAAAWANDVPELLRTAERAMTIAGRLGNEVLWANAAVLYGNGMTWAGRGQEADAHMEAAWEIGDRLNHPWVPFLATWCGQGDLCWRGEVARGRRLCERELAKPRTMQAPGQRDYLESLLAWNATLAGDLALAREIVDRSSPDVVPPFAAGLLELLAGDPATAVSTIERWRRRLVERGNAWTAMTYEYDIAQVQWALGDPAVDATYDRIAAAATAAGGALFELMYRCQIARRRVELGRLDEARAEVARCRELFAAGNRWGAREGDLALAEATVAAAGGEDVDARFREAVDIYARHGVVWDQAEALQHWAVALGPRDPAAATALLDAAHELYGRHGASTLWLERVARRRAQLSMSW